jgi:HSP20 family protein
MDKEQIRKEWEEGLLIAPTVDIYETDDDFILKALMPGVKKDNVDVKYAEGALTVYGRVDIKDPVKESYVLKEIENGNYYRVFKVSDSIDVDKIQAKMFDGILTLTLPKHERVKPKEIPITLE